MNFDTLWINLYPDIDLIEEYRFNPTRRFRADYAHPASKVLIEIQGGTWMRGKSKHSSGVGINRDIEKAFLAAADGFLLFPLTPKMVDEQHLAQIAKAINSRLNLNPLQLLHQSML